MSCKNCKVLNVTVCPIAEHAYENGKNTKRCSFRKVIEWVYMAGGIMGRSEYSEEIGRVILKVYQAGRDVGTFGPRR